MQFTKFAENPDLIQSNPRMDQSMSNSGVISFAGLSGQIKKFWSYRKCKCLHLVWNCDRGVDGCMVGLILPEKGGGV